MVQNILLNEEGKTKLKILNRVRELGKGQYPIYFFENELGFSYVKTSKLIHSMDMELQQLDPHFHLLNDRDKIEIKGDIPYFEDYQRFLCRQSLSYRFLLSTILYPNKSMADFCIEEKLSQSSVMRRLRPLISYLKESHIRLNCLQMKLTGKESVIRMIITHFIWYVSFGEDLTNYFAKEKELHMEELFSPEDSRWMIYGEEKEWNVYQGVALLRIQQGYVIDENIFQTFSLPVINKKFREILTEQKLSETAIQRENHFIGYAMFYKIQYFSIHDPRLKYVKKYLETNKVVSEHTQNFYDFCVKELFSTKISSEQNKLIWIDLFNLFLKKDVFPEVVFSYNLSTSTLMTHYHPMLLKLKKKINQFLDREYRFESARLKEREDLLILLSAIVLPYFEEEKVKKTVHLGIAGVQDESLLHFLFYHLKQITGIEIEICGNKLDKEYDLLLSSATKFLPEPMTRPYYILDTENMQMLHHIQKKIDSLLLEN